LGRGDQCLELARQLTSLNLGLEIAFGADGPPDVFGGGVVARPGKFERAFERCLVLVHGPTIPALNPKACYLSAWRPYGGAAAAQSARISTSRARAARQRAPAICRRLTTERIRRRLRPS